MLACQSLFLHHSPHAALSILAFVQFFLTGFVLADVVVADWGEAPARSIGWDIVGLLGWPGLFLMLRFPALAHWLFPAWIFLLYCVAFRGPLANRILSNPWITTIGGMCYSIYLLHYEVISAAGRFTKRIGALSTPYWIYLLLQFLLVGQPFLFFAALTSSSLKNHVCGGTGHNAFGATHEKRFSFGGRSWKVTEPTCKRGTSRAKRAARRDGIE